MQFYITINSGRKVLSVIVLMREGQLVNVPLGDLLDGISALRCKLEPGFHWVVVHRRSLSYSIVMIADALGQ